MPENVSAAVAPPVNVISTKLADGVFYLTGGTHHSLAVEMSDHIVLIDTPNNEARALAVIAKAKDVIKGIDANYWRRFIVMFEFVSIKTNAPQSRRNHLSILTSMWINK